jgi:long-subunit acyl-CoA synthetase (AMP-forming)
VKAVKQRLNSRGAEVHITQGYGLTETSPVTHLLMPEHSMDKVGSVGWLLPNIQARLVDETNGKAVDVPVGEPGEIWVRGANIMKGYLNNKQATRDSITPDGWFKTGDVGVVDDKGFFFIVDRRKELIKYKGFQGKSTISHHLWCLIYKHAFPFSSARRARERTSSASRCR